MVGKQIEVELSLSATRMNWNLTFQGFMIAGYALLSTADGATPSRLVLQITIALAAFGTTIGTLMGLYASGMQRQYLKDIWRDNGLYHCFPAPFSNDTGSQLGRHAARSICCALLLMWAVLFVTAFTDFKDPPEPKQIAIKEMPALQLPLAPAPDRVGKTGDDGHSRAAQSKR